MDGKPPIAARFRGFYPVIIDVETGGFNAATDGLLEIAAVPLTMEDGILKPLAALHAHIEPFAGAVLNPEALKFTGIDPFNPLRGAQEEKNALKEMFAELKRLQRLAQCNRCILVGHNANFDLQFLKAAVERTNLKNANPFHPFSVFDTVSLAGLMFGQTVLAKACFSAGLNFQNAEAHSALYDAQKTAELFCLIVNRWQTMGGLQDSVNVD
ncbi:RNAse T [Agitococcus lubricus]|uniref:Ribonuclease T n=2 Tax=Agitococcus lubricus TaxID=1077255 RepID=A0A2T5IZ70_9GAMM|nr:RNAse T [Agitococcus lubricus]